MGIFSFIFLTSCSIYTPNEILEKGEQILEKHKKELIKLDSVFNSFSLGDCKMYFIRTSNRNNQIVCSEFYFKDRIKKIKKRESVHINDQNKYGILKYRPKKTTTYFYFVKNLYSAFEINHCRTENKKSVKLIYCHNKWHFRSLFPDYYYFDDRDKKNIVDTVKWVYFYDEHWGITNSSVFFKNTRKECIKLTQ